MKKQVVQITEDQLSSLIEKSISEAISEMDGATYSRLYNASHREMDDIQNGIPTRTVGCKTTNNDETIKRATQMQLRVQQHWLGKYIGKTFKFFTEDRMGLVAHLLFSLEKVTKLDTDKTVLVGEVVFNDRKISGDGITIDFSKNRVRYHERGSRFAYNLVIDNRVAPLWNELLEQLKMALDNRKGPSQTEQTILE